MKKNELVSKAYEIAKERYAALGVNVDEVLDKLQKIQISIHCWQADDVTGFEDLGNMGGGGIQATGNYPGKARNIDELRADIEKVQTQVGGNHRLSLHAIYGDFGGKTIDRDQVDASHFTSWMQWAKEKGLKLDFNSSSFGHPKSGDLTLANPDKSIRDFWMTDRKT